ncbi:MAG: molybdopterin-dependent oxidoreductase, partial [Verrucomicrobiota bacterium]
GDEDLVTDIHCVTGWSQFDMRFTGMRLSHFFDRSGIRIPSEVRWVRFQAYSDRMHDASLPVEVALADSWLVHSFEGKPLTPSRGFPLRVVTPGKYFYKSLKWLKAISFSEKEIKGFWERTSGYHQNADPWLEQRLDGTRFASKAEADAFRACEDFSPYRSDGRVLIKVNLRDWDPVSRDLSGLQLKACDFSGAQLQGVSFAGANLTFAKFRGADLRNVDFSGADLEGADFCGADLSGARLTDNDLSATTFCWELGEASSTGLKGHDGLCVKNPEGLVEAQEAYLHSIGVMGLGKR